MITISAWLGTWVEAGEEARTGSVTGAAGESVTASAVVGNKKHIRQKSKCKS